MKAMRYVLCVLVLGLVVGCEEGADSMAVPSTDGTATDAGTGTGTGTGGTTTP
jgi:hypothetical protein